jgi:hypothetical protein
MNEPLGEILDKWQSGVMGSNEAIVEVFKLRAALAEPEPTGERAEYVPLTDRQIYEMHDWSCLSVLAFARAIERAARGAS